MTAARPQSQHPWSEQSFLSAAWPKSQHPWSIQSFSLRVSIFNRIFPYEDRRISLYCIQTLSTRGIPFEQCCGTGNGTGTVGTVTFRLVEPEP